MQTDTCTRIKSDTCTRSKCSFWKNFFALVGRVLIGIVFIIAAVGKIGNWDATLSAVTNANLPLPSVALTIAIIIEILGGLSLVLGLGTRISAIVLALFIIVVTIVFHGFWSLTGDAAVTAQQDFVRNVYYFGALLLLVAFGPGRYSLDAKRCPHLREEPPRV